jgi:hypothetical protein
MQMRGLSISIEDGLVGTDVLVEIVAVRLFLELRFGPQKVDGGPPAKASASMRHAFWRLR